MSIHQVIEVLLGALGILVAVLFWFMPRLTRHELYFAVTVAAGFRDTPEGRSVLRSYRTELVVFSVAALGVFSALVTLLGIGFVREAFFIQLAAPFVALYRARRRVLPHAVPPTTVREADLHGRQRTTPGGWIVASGPFLLLAACAAYLWSTGRQSAHTDVLLLSIVSVLAALTLILYGTAHWARPIHAGGPEGMRELKFHKTACAVLLAVEYFITLQASWIAIFHLHGGLKTGRHGALALGLLTLIPIFYLVVVVVLARLGQGGGRWSTAAPVVPVGDRTQDSYWKLGIFYCNRDDPAVLIESRFGLGLTLNFGRPVAWIILGLVLFGILAPVLAFHLHS